MKFTFALVLLLVSGANEKEVGWYSAPNKRDCKKINFSTDGRCGNGFGHTVCSGKDGKWLFCSDYGWCGNSNGHMNGKTDYDFPHKCVWADDCEEIKFSTDGRCGESYGHAVCSGKDGEWLFCNDHARCCNTNGHKNKKTDYDFPSKCVWADGKIITRPVDCVMSKWLKSGHCNDNSVKCGGTGTQNEYRKVKTPAKHGGTACPTQREKTETCDMPKCKVCHDNHETFDAGYGGCETYSPNSGNTNHEYCSMDRKNGLFAEDVCEECGMCKNDKTPQTEAPETEETPETTAAANEHAEVSVSKLLMEQNKRLKELLLALN